MFRIARYTHADAEQWNRFAAGARQATFLFDRNYMDYHADRFSDFSLIIRRNGQLRALLPANIEGRTLVSHRGLTYGGLITDAKTQTADACEIFRAIADFLRAEGVERVIYKPTPWIYHRLPAEEDLYAIVNICNARLVSRHISSAISQRSRLPIAESRKSGIRKALRQSLRVCESADPAPFWHILTRNLEHKYNARPVHSLDEIKLLMSRFPRAIRLFQVESPGGSVLGGTLVYETPRVAHTQYISASDEGKAVGALDLLFRQLIQEQYSNVEYFDFGKSSDADGHQLNAPLIFQKEGFGARGVCYDTYEWTL